MSKSWTAVGYIHDNEINASNEDAIIPYSSGKVGTLVEKLCCENAHTNFEDNGAVGPDHFHPSYDDGDYENEEIFIDFY